MSILYLFILISTARGCLVVTDNLHNQRIAIHPHGNDGLRIRAIPYEQEFYDTPGIVSALLNESSPLTTCALAVLAYDRSVQYHNGNIMLTINVQDGAMTFTRISDGRVLIQETSSRLFLKSRLKLFNPERPLFVHKLMLRDFDDERIYGLGQHKTGVLDNKKHGKPFSFAPENTETFIPVMHSSRGYVFLFNHPGFGSVKFRSKGETVWTAKSVLQMDFWIATTSESDDVSPWKQLQQKYYSVTGYPGKLPRSSVNMWQSKNRYHNQSQVKDIAHRYIRGISVPLSFMVIDYKSWNPYPMGDFSMNERCWPNTSKLVEQLHKDNTSVMVSTYFHTAQTSSKYYDYAAKQGFFATSSPTINVVPSNFWNHGAIYDVFQKSVRDFVWQKVQSSFIGKHGIRHFWIDCDEPCEGDAGKLWYNQRRWPASFVGSAYPHMLIKMVHENAPGTITLSRSAWAGSQRFGNVAVWSGDVDSTFSSLEQQIKAGLNMMMSGIPYWTTDIGGYHGGDVDSSYFRQLVVRWFQWAIFTPIVRLHGKRKGGPTMGGGDPSCLRTESTNEIWNFGNASSFAIRRALEVRHSMTDYISELYLNVSKHGDLIMRPLFYDFWWDPLTFDIEDQYMFGPSYLVAPQYKYNAEKRSVYLPLGRWCHVFHPERIYDGPIYVQVFTFTQSEQFSTIPVFRKLV